MAPWKRQNLGGLSLDVGQASTIECTTLQVKSVKLDACTLVELAIFERRNKLKFIDSDLELSSRSLSERVQEGLRVQQVTNSDWTLKESTLLNLVDPIAQRNTFLVQDSQPLAWIDWAFPHLLPLSRKSALE